MLIIPDFDSIGYELAFSFLPKVGRRERGMFPLVHHCSLGALLYYRALAPKQSYTSCLSRCSTRKSRSWKANPTSSSRRVVSAFFVYEDMTSARSKPHIGLSVRTSSRKIRTGVSQPERESLVQSYRTDSMNLSFQAFHLGVFLFLQASSTTKKG